MTFNESPSQSSTETSDQPPQREFPVGTDPPVELDIVITEGGAATSEECAMFPKDADDETMDTQWIQARGDAFVDLREIE